MSWLLVRFLLRRNTLTQATLRGHALNGHPCPSSALAASMRLGPLRAACVRPAPKSRLASSGLSRTKSKIKSECERRFGGGHTSSVRHKTPVAVRLAGGGVRTIAAAGKPDCYRKARNAHALALAFDLLPRNPRHRRTRLGCRPNAGDVEWAERQGCRESRPRPWMADGGGPTEHRRS